jgi:plastocyanin
MVYVPDFLVVPVGSTVKFILVGGPDPSHPLGFFPPLNYSVSISGKDTVYTYTFTQAGVYRYYCTEHNTSGSVTVK